MKIFSDIQVSPENNPIFVLYLDTEKTGIHEHDCLNSAQDYTPFVDNMDAEKLVNMITAMVAELIYTAYGESPEITGKKPITDWHATGFNRNYPNGVKL